MKISALERMPRIIPEFLARTAGFLSALLDSFKQTQSELKLEYSVKIVH